MLPVARAEKGSWGEWVVAKLNLPELLAKELASLQSLGKLHQTAIFMSSATDPYQGVERQALLTRASLEALTRHPIRRLLLQTRSPMVERDIDILKSLGSSVIVSITLETDDDAVRRALTPTSPSVKRRIEACQRLRSEGIYVQLAIAPMMPNAAERFAEMARASADRVVVDTYFDGDGAKGRRSRALGMAEIYTKLGFEGWFREGAEADLIAALKRRLGPDRVLFSRAGFNSV